MEGVVKPGLIGEEHDTLFKNVAKEIGVRYKEVGIDLGLTFMDLQNLLETGHTLMLPANEKALIMLNLWKSETPENKLTYSVLCDALKKNNLMRCAHKYCMDHADPASRSAEQPTLGATESTTFGWKFNLEEKRGLAIIVTCDYNGSDKELPTTNEDGDEMVKTLRDHLDYDVHTIRNNDVTKENVIKMLQAVNHYLENYKGNNELNPDGRYKAVVFAFAGHGGSGRGNEDYIQTVDEKQIKVMAHIVAAFMGKEGTLMKIPKLFFFDACRGKEWLTAALRRGEEKKEVNYRIDYAIIPEHSVEATNEWMCLVAKLLREKDVSLADVMAEVKKTVYDELATYPQQPETKDRLVTGPLMLYHKK